VDVTEADEIRTRYLETRPAPAIIVLDNLDELGRSQPERVRNELRDAAEDKLRQWSESYNGILRRYDRDRFLAVFEKKDLERMKQSRFPIVEQMHQIESPNGIEATISIGFGEDGENLGEGLQFADKATELALSRGGDQVAVKNQLSFEFFGGRGLEVEKRTKVKSRVMANTLAELIRDSSQVLAMGHRFADLDSVGAAVGICCLTRSCGVRARIVIDLDHNAGHSLIERLRKEEAYRDAFISPAEAKELADGRTLLVVVDTNRPEQVEDAELLDLCSRVAVIDHHRVAATYIHNAALGFIEPYASSACELVTEILQEVTEPGDMLRCEAEAMLAGIVLDTKSFSIRTGERTFDAAAYLRRGGADTAEVKKLFQAGMDDTVARYKILQQATLHGKVAIAAPEEPQSRVVAAKAADEMLNISGVEASIVVSPDDRGNINISARSIGEVNVQILMEKLGGGGNRSAAAAQLKDTTLPDAVERVYAVIDEYFG
jgi:c-di-AMP phosphodiesterase-like protein